jgi:hypothetical protein
LIFDVGIRSNLALGVGGAESVEGDPAGDRRWDGIVLSRVDRAAEARANSSDEKAGAVEAEFKLAEGAGDDGATRGRET